MTCTIYTQKAALELRKMGQNARKTARRKYLESFVEGSGGVSFDFSRWEGSPEILGKALEVCEGKFHTFTATERVRRRLGLNTHPARKATREKVQRCKRE